MHWHPIQPTQSRSYVVSISIGYVGSILLLCIGIAATAGQILMTEGYRYVSVTTGSLLAMLVPVLNVFVGATIFHELISSRAIVGSVIVLGACVAVLSMDKTETYDEPQVS